MDKHTIAAHKIADAFDTIAAEFANLPDEERKALAVAFSLTELSLSNSFGILAGMHRRKHPFEPVPEAQRAELAEEAIDCFRDMSVREYIEELLPKSEWEWRCAADLHRTELVDALDDDPECATEALADWDALATEGTTE